MRAINIAAVIGLHIIIVYALLAGLHRSPVNTFIEPIETRIIEEVAQEEDKPPPPPPELKQPLPFIPPPELVIDAPSDQQSAAITQVQMIIPARSDPGRPNTVPMYPPTSRRLSEEGVVLLNLYILASGKVGDARIHTSSGSPRLDEAARREALRNWRYLPALQGAAPVASWLVVSVKFQLVD